jgi:hypothetical protein
VKRTTGKPLHSLITINTDSLFSREKDSDFLLPTSYLTEEQKIKRIDLDEKKKLSIRDLTQFPFPAHLRLFTKKSTSSTKTQNSLGFPNFFKFPKISTRFQKCTN